MDYMKAKWKHSSQIKKNFAWSPKNKKNMQSIIYPDVILYLFVLTNSSFALIAVFIWSVMISTSMVSLNTHVGAAEMIIPPPFNILLWATHTKKLPQLHLQLLLLHHQ